MDILEGELSARSQVLRHPALIQQTWSRPGELESLSTFARRGMVGIEAWLDDSKGAKTLNERGLRTIEEILRSLICWKRDEIRLKDHGLEGFFKQSVNDVKRSVCEKSLRPYAPKRLHGMLQARSNVGGGSRWVEKEVRLWSTSYQESASPNSSKSLAPPK